MLSGDKPNISYYDALDSAYKEGKGAAREGKKLGDNPYKEGTASQTLRSFWSRGWMAENLGKIK